MNIIFEVTDKSGRKIRLTKKQWEHITTTHRDMTNYLEEIKGTIENPMKITEHTAGNLKKYFRYIKNKKGPDNYLRLIIKYLNGDGFVLTAHFIRSIK